MDIKSRKRIYIYIYINGSVKNIGKTQITYYKISAKFLDDNNNVLDSDYTNSIEVLQPNEQRKFEIMHKNDEKFKKVHLDISEVK